MDDDPLHAPPLPRPQLRPPADPKVELEIFWAEARAGGRAATSPLTLGMIQSEELRRTRPERVLVCPVTVSRREDVTGGDQDAATVREHSTVCKTESKQMHFVRRRGQSAVSQFPDQLCHYLSARPSGESLDVSGCWKLRRGFN